MNLNPWTTRFAKQWTDPEIDAIVEVSASPLDLNQVSAEAGSEILRNALSQIFVASDQTRKILRQLNDLALGHAQSHFFSSATYEHGLYKSNPWGEICAPAVCFTGLAGTGKSALITALQKLLGAPTSTNISGMKGVPLTAGWFLTLRDGARLNLLLRPHVMPGERQNEINDGETPRSMKDVKISELLRLARRRSWRDGVCLLGADEFQFITLGSEANAKATSALLNLLGIGPRLIYVANFSLGHRLKKRGHEDRARLVHHPIILQPETCSSPDWARLLKEFKKVAPEILTYDVDATEELIHRYTFGMKRSVIALLVAAFRETRNRGRRNSIGADEILLAYKSAEYSSHREDVETLWRQRFAGKMEREDLWCPFEQLDYAGNILIAKQATEAFERRVDDEYMNASLTPAEAVAMGYIEPKQFKAKTPGKVIRMPRQKVTKESLLDASKMLDDLRS